MSRAKIWFLIFFHLNSHGNYSFIIQNLPILSNPNKTGTLKTLNIYNNNIINVINKIIAIVYLFIRRLDMTNVEQSAVQ